MSSAERPAAPWFAQSLRLIALAILSLVVLLVVAGLSLSSRGRAAMVQSDSAFHNGERRASVVHAREAALCYVPGSAHVRRAHERIEAVAKGAEAEGDLPLARFSWDTLRLVHVQTHYPGRVTPPGLSRAETGLQRLRGVQ